MHETRRQIDYLQNKQKEAEDEKNLKEKSRLEAKKAAEDRAKVKSFLETGEEFSRFCVRRKSL